MSPLNKGPLGGPRVAPPLGPRPPMGPRFHRMPLPGMRPPPRLPLVNPIMGPHQRMMPRPGPMMGPPIFGPIPPMPPMLGPRGPRVPRGPIMRPGPRGNLPPQGLHHMRPRFPVNGNGNKSKGGRNSKKANKLEELELKKPWMTNEIRIEIQKKNRLYAKAKKNKDAKEWEEFKDLRNKVTRMIRDAKNEYLAKHPDQIDFDENDDVTKETNSVNESNSNRQDESIFFCEACDRDFSTSELLDNHLKEHQICNIDGCTFTAHFKIVEKHISMQHITGLYDRMKNIITDEDIEKWKLERKKNYPTSNRIRMLEAEKLEKCERGEIIECRKNKRRNNFKKDKIPRNRRRKRVKHNDFDNNESNEEHLEMCQGIPRFKGTSFLTEENTLSDSERIERTDISNEVTKECTDFIEPMITNTENFIISDEECLEDSPSSKQNNVPSAITMGLSLVADYVGDSDSDEPPEETPIQKTGNISDHQILNNLEEKLNYSDVAHSEPHMHEKHTSCIDKIDHQTKESIKESSDISNRLNKRQRKPNRKEKRNSKINSKTKNSNSQYSSKELSLLNHLLSREIQHERNLICQCITFIAKNNFFDC